MVVRFGGGAARWFGAARKELLNDRKNFLATA
jgi:hypothetical protein